MGSSQNGSPILVLWWKMNARSQFSSRGYALGCCKPKGPIAPSALQSVLFPFLVALFRVLFHDRASSYFFCATAVASAFLGTFLDVFVLTLLFCTDTLEMFLTRHADLHASYSQSLSH